jgi:hypothetical protein
MHPLDPWRVANLLIQQHGSDADLQAAMRADALWDAGDQAGFAVWTQIINAIDALRRDPPRPGEARH